MYRIILYVIKGFQYSPSHEGAHKYACFRNISLLISILPLSRGGSNFRLLSALCSNFNTPPLTRGLGVVIDGSLCIDISILPLSRGGSAISKACLVLSVFQYSPSHEGAHCLPSIVCHPLISILPLSRGGSAKSHNYMSVYIHNYTKY